MSGRQLRLGPPPPSGDASLDQWHREVYDALRLMPSDSTTTTVTASYSVPFHSGVIYFNGASTGTITLPSGVTYRNAYFDIKNLSAHTMVIASAANIEGSASTETNTQNFALTLHNDGSTYRVL